MFSFFLLLKEVRTLNKIQKTIATLLIIAAIVFVAGCASQSSTQKSTASTEKAGSPGTSPTETDLKWIQMSKTEGSALSKGVNTLDGLLGNMAGEDLDNVLNQLSSVNSISDRTLKASQSMTVSPDFQSTKAEFESMAYSYRAFSSLLISGISKVSQGQQTQGEADMREGKTYFGQGKKQYINYSNLLEEYLKNHPT